MKLPEQANGESPTTVDVHRLMEEIRQQVAKDGARSRDAQPRYIPETPAVEAGQLIHAEELRFLNANYAFESKLSPAAVISHRRGILGKLVVKVKRRILAAIRASFLDEYLKAERQFQENVVRHLNTVSRYVDARDGELFGQLVRKIDRDCAQIARKLERTDDEATTALFSLKHEVDERLAESESIVRGLEVVINSQGHRLPQGEVMSEAVLQSRRSGVGTQREHSLLGYGEIFQGASGTVLEIGSATGELQQVFLVRGIPSYGVDSNAAAVAVANSAGCNTVHGDGVQHLRTLSHGVLGGLVARQVVQHLSPESLRELFALAKSKVRRGGLVALETINPQSFLALSKNGLGGFPRHPDTLVQMATVAGLSLRETRFLSPVSPHFLLREIPNDSSYTSPFRDGIQRLNANIQQLNALLYGYQDYCVVFEVE